MSDVRWDGAQWVPMAPAADPELSADTLRSLDWRQFEALVARAYERHGFVVTRTPDGADGGIDLVLSRGGERWFVQCKHWKAWKVGAPVVREMRGLVAHHGASGGIIVTSGKFSDDAYAFARESGIQLVGGPATLTLVTTGQLPDASLLGGTAAIGTATASPQVGPPRCPVCAGAMALRQAHRGAHRGESFWGCLRYPSCRGMVPAQPWEAPATTAPSGSQAFAPRAGNRYVAVPPQRSAGGRQPRRSVGRVLAAALVPPIAGIAALVVGLNIISGMLSSWGTGQPGRKPAGYAPTVGTAAPTTEALPAGTVKVGGQPMAISVDPNERVAYTANFDSGDVSVIDLEGMRVVNRIDVPGRPSAVAVDTERGVLWVADYNAASVRGIDLATNAEVASLKTEEHPDHLAVDPGADRLYVTCRETDDVLVFNTAKQKRLKSIKGSQAGALALDIANQHLYVAKRSAGNVYRYDLKRKDWERVSMGSLGSPDIDIDGDRGRLYVADIALRERNLVVGGSRTLVDSNVSAVAVDPKSGFAYVVDTEAATVTAVSLD